MKTDDGQGQFSWKAHDGKAVKWRDGRGGTMWMYEHGDEENQEETRKRCSSSKSQRAVESLLGTQAKSRNIMPGTW